MTITGWQQALTLLFAVIPGFIYQGTRSALRGPTPDDRDTSVRILRALAVSGFLALLYVGILGECLTNIVIEPGFPLVSPRRTAWILIGLIFVVPIASALLIHHFQPMRRLAGLGAKAGFSAYDATPTAWDFASDRMQVGFVRVLTKDQTWLGGYLGEKSYFTGYPEPREIFLEQAWELDDQGVFGEAVKGTSGVWIRCDDVQLVQFLEEPQNEGEVRSDNGT